MVWRVKDSCFFVLYDDTRLFVNYWARALQNEQLKDKAYNKSIGNITKGWILKLYY